MRVLLDTSVLVSALLSPNGACAQLVARLVADPDTALVSSDGMIDELERTILAESLMSRFGYREEDALHLIALIRERCDLVPTDDPHHVCRDPGDDMVLETARSGEVAWLVTGDKDMLFDPGAVQFAETHSIQTITVRGMLDRLAADQEGK